MKPVYFPQTSLRRLALTALLSAGSWAAHAQFTYSPGQTNTVAGTYTDLGTAGTAIATANNDDANSAAQNIGFTFTFNGTAFTQFVLNTNGLVRLGAQGPAAALAASPYAQNPEIGPINSTDPADVNLLLPFNFDLGPGTGTPEYRVATTGAAGSRVCTIQWKNVADKAVATSSTTTTPLPAQYTNFAFQVKLYEGSNRVEFVYDAPTTGAVSALKYAVVGLKGSGSSSSVLANKQSAAAWSNTTFFVGPQPDEATGNANNFRSVAPPDAGRTYRFVPSQPNDAAVATLYTLGKLARSLNAGHQVQAVVVNRGTNALTNVPVTLSVTGANTFTNTQTVAALAPNAATTVTFGAYPAGLALGTNNVTVTVPADDNSANNAATYTQQVTNDQVLIADPALGATGIVSYSSNIGGGVLAAKFTVGGTSNRLTNAVFYFSPSSPATTAYQAVVFNATATGAPGAALYTSPILNRPAAGGSVTVPLNNTAVPNTYFIGIREVGTTGAGLGTQIEVPTRTNTFYASGDGITWLDIAGTAFQVRLLIEANLSVTLASASPALQRALTLYPNPSASGVFTLDAHGAQAGAASMAVEVTNQLGQRVYVGTARDNFANPLNLSHLTPGLYHLTVRNGNEHATTKLTIGM